MKGVSYMLSCSSSDKFIIVSMMPTSKRSVKYMTKVITNGIIKGQVLSLNLIIHCSHHILFARSERVLRLCYPRRDGADNILLFLYLI